MPDRRQHRGAHPRDLELFGAQALPALRTAASDLAWLVSRGYAHDSALALVGNRYSLTARQRTAVSRVTCSDELCRMRRSRLITPEQVLGRALRVDGFNVCITVEVALGGGVVLAGREGAQRDLASVHGTYRRVVETPKALTACVEELAGLRPGSVCWYFDRPVSNSGTLARLLREVLRERGLDWQVVLDEHVDRVLTAPGAVAASADGNVLDGAEAWFDLSGFVIGRRVPEAWRVDVWGQHSCRV